MCTVRWNTIKLVVENVRSKINFSLLLCLEMEGLAISQCGVLSRTSNCSTPCRCTMTKLSRIRELIFEDTAHSALSREGRFMGVDRLDKHKHVVTITTA